MLLKYDFWREAIINVSDLFGLTIDELLRSDEDITLLGGKFLWNFGSLFLMVGAGVCSSILKEKYKKD
ncbi:hypothetical protein [Paenibacillus eucommiae]|uniref:Uncharacterized protein n=1 Tax=Paenibacillus eucommiae TaxID=1355755 RepID=A0ABS4J5K5_9BACL|nr:hypothetical protein [Paenibacillus eucommiae]